jgi:hypothetical protein
VVFGRGSRRQAPPSRRWRARERAGLILLKFPVDEAAVVVALTDRGLLDPLRADDLVAINEAAQRALVEFCGETAPHEQNICYSACNFDPLSWGIWSAPLGVDRWGT